MEERISYTWLNGDTVMASDRICYPLLQKVRSRASAYGAALENY